MHVVVLHTRAGSAKLLFATQPRAEGQATPGAFRPLWHVCRQQVWCVKFVLLLLCGLRTKPVPQLYTRHVGPESSVLNIRFQ